MTVPALYSVAFRKALKLRSILTKQTNVNYDLPTCWPFIIDKPLKHDKLNTTNKTRRTKKMRKRAVKSYGSQLEIKAKTYGLFIDWLTLNLQGEPELNDLKYTFDKKDYSTRHFSDVYEVSKNGEKIGVLVFGKRNNTIQIENFCQFKFENHLFYTKTLSELKELKDELLKDLKLTYHGVSRLDLAIDFQNASNKVQKFYQAIVNQKILIGGREKDFNKYNQLKTFSRTKGGLMTLEGIQIGSRKSRKFCRLYNKTLELQKTNKSYITQTWENLKIKGEVWRLEYQMNSTYLSSLEGFELDLLFDKNYLMSLYDKCIDKHFVFHHKTRAKELNKMPVANLLNFQTVRQSFKVVTKKLKFIKRKINETLIGQMRYVKACFRSYFSTGQSLEYILPLNRTLDDFGLTAWFDMKRPYYIAEFEKKQIIKEYDYNKLNDHLSITI